MMDLNDMQQRALIDFVLCNGVEDFFASLSMNYLDKDEIEVMKRIFQERVNQRESGLW